MKANALLDPGLLCWDSMDYVLNKSKYWVLIEQIIKITEILDRPNICMLFTSKLANELIEIFPIGEIAHENSDLRDFCSLMYSLFSKWSSSEYEISEVDDVISITPDICNRSHLSQIIKAELKKIMSYVNKQPYDTGFITHCNVLDFNQTGLCCITRNSRFTLQIIDNQDKCIEFYKKYSLFYEENRKHNSLNGYGSRLPIYIGKQELQDLLDYFVCCDESASFVIFSIKYKILIVFKRHSGNLYHAYPIDEGELSRMRLSKKDVPRK
ncbi:MAG: hypothetical protein AB1306_08435 [Nitrospirota bacterium]